LDQHSPRLGGSPLILVAAMQFLFYRNDDTAVNRCFLTKISLKFTETTKNIRLPSVMWPSEEAKTELKEIVEFLKDAERFNKIGGVFLKVFS
jgi:cell division protease FtsH